MSALPPVTTQSILVQVMPIIEAALTQAIDTALAAGGPVTVAVAGTLSAMVPVILAQIAAAQNTPAQASALAAALAQLDKDIAAAP
jgi:hypothetical protein